MIKKIKTGIDILSKPMIFKKNYINKLSKKIINKSLCDEKVTLTSNFINKIQEEQVKNLRESVDICSMSWRINKYLNYEYDVLGSGWKSVSNKEQTSIDWNRDILTDKNIKVDNSFDIKYVWELSRLYHLPQMAIFSIDNDDYIKYEKEIYAQILSISVLDDSHPCWNSPMDIAIRMCNELVTIDICRCNKNSIFYDIEKMNVLRNHFERSFNLVLNNLEYNLSYGKHGNHYLSNLVGLLFCMSYYKTPDNKNLFIQIKNEFINEINNQILSDGSIYECSTGYHSLSLELILFGLAIVISEFPEEILIHEFTRVYKAIEFLKVHSHKGNIVQIGDNDSGRLFKISPNGEWLSINELSKININYRNHQNNNEYYFDENYLNIGDLLNFKYIFQLNENENEEYIFNKSKLELFYGISKCKNKIVIKDTLDNKINIQVKDKHIKNLNYKQNFRIPNVGEGKFKYYPDFGSLVFYTDDCQFNNIYFRIPYDKNNKLLAHVHDDIFSVDTQKYTDNGSFSYRNENMAREYFRSNKAHFMPIFPCNNVFFHDVFSADLNFDEYSIFIDSNNTINIFASWKDIVFLRKIYVEEDLIVCDYSNNQFRYNYPDAELFSLGYGKINKKVEDIRYD